MRNRPKLFLHTRFGATILEVLIVLSIIFVLISLLLGAIQKIRQVSFKIECSNNLHQLGLAMHSYDAAYSAFPPGVRDRLSGDPYPFMGWCARMLPYVGMENLWKETTEAYAKELDFRIDPPHSHLRSKIRMFTCPAGTEPVFKGPAYSSIGFGWYLGVSGNAENRSSNGMLFLNSSVRFSDILDGSSNTLLLGERPPSAIGDLGWWYAGWGQYKDGSGDMVLSVQEKSVYYPDCGPGPFEYKAGTTYNSCDAFHYWSYHVGGSHFLLADGSIRFISYRSDSLLSKLASRAGGESSE